MFHGSIAALVTPFDDHGQVDEKAFARLLEWHRQEGTDGVVVAGTTGESAALTPEEFSALVGLAVDVLGGQLPVIAGTGTSDTARTIDRTREAAALGADAALVVTPYYNRPPQAGLVAHFTAVADAVDLPLILYNVPTRTAVDMLPETAARLAGHSGIVALKEAFGGAARIAELREACGERLAVLSGDDPTCLAAMEQGAAGVISVAANVAPAHMHRLCAAARGRDRALARLLNDELGDLYRNLGVATNPIPVKWAVWRLGLIGPGIRLPLLPLEPQHRPALEACLNELGLLPGDQNTNAC